MTSFSPASVIVINYTIVILSSSLIATKGLAEFFTYDLGFLTLIALWLEFSDSNSKTLLIYRLVFSFLLFGCFCVILIRQLIKVKDISHQFILGPILGFLYLGIIGGVIFEFFHFLDPNSINQGVFRL
jgi:hypothetical protein